MPLIHLRGIQAGPDGIVWARTEELNRSVWIRIRSAPDGRNEIEELYLDADERAISTDDLRRIPLGKIEAYANSARGRAELERLRGSERISLLEFVEDSRSRGRELIPRARSRTREAGQVGPPSADALEARARALMAELEVPANVARYDDSFYQSVAVIYQALVDAGIAPAPCIHQATGVPLTTARRWVKEARSRGHLPPGRAGKVG